MTREDLVRRMGLESWNEYAVPAMNSALGDHMGEDKAAATVYFEAILPARAERGLMCVGGSLDEILDKLSTERRRLLKLIIKQKVEDLYHRYVVS